MSRRLRRFVPGAGCELARAVTAASWYPNEWSVMQTNRYSFQGLADELTSQTYNSVHMRLWKVLKGRR